MEVADGEETVWIAIPVFSDEHPGCPEVFLNALQA